MPSQSMGLCSSSKSYATYDTANDLFGVSIKGDFIRAQPFNIPNPANALRLPC